MTIHQVRVPMLYVASPYSSPSECERINRSHAASLASARLTRAEIPHFAPISWDHEIPIEDGFNWYAYDLEYLARCDALLVLTIDGWRQSLGVQLEIEYAYELGIPVFDECAAQSLTTLLIGEVADKEDMSRAVMRGYAAAVRRAASDTQC